jgi:hypothetical protein
MTARQLRVLANDLAQGHYSMGDAVRAIREAADQIERMSDREADKNSGVDHPFGHKVQGQNDR